MSEFLQTQAEHVETLAEVLQELRKQKSKEKQKPE